MNMTLTNLETVPGRRIVQHLGLVQGNTVRSKHVGRDIMAGLKNIVGGELKGYTELLSDARDEATSVWFKKLALWALMQSSIFVIRRLRFPPARLSFMFTALP